MQKSSRIAVKTPARLVGSILNTLTRISPGMAGRIAFTLFCTPRKKQVKPAELAFLATADLYYEEVNGQHFAVYHWGFRGPVVLLAHGWESHAGRWRKIAPLLVQAGYQVMAVDAPAHGRSDGKRFTMIHYAEVLRTLLHRFGPIDSIIAHSVGGAAGIWAMGTAGPAARPQKAVILAPFSELKTVLEGARRTIGAGQPLMNAIDAYILKKTGAPTSHYSLTKMAEKMTGVETLIVHDRQDQVTAYSESVKIHEAWPYSKLWSTDGFGHGLTAPEVIDGILQFVVQNAWVE
jgi:pimeloyl-ACP methyl ester carboxylesterase